MTNKKLWLVGKFKEITKSKNTCWSFEGIYSKEKDAIKRAITEKHFVAPVFINKEIPDKDVDWRGLYYPSYNKEKV